MARKRPKVSLAREIPPQQGDLEQLFATEGDVEQAAGLRLLAVRLDAISPDPEQPRSTFDDDSLKDLSDSIRQDGVIQPIEVTEVAPGRYMIVHGERRWRAARMAGLETIPAVVRRKDYDTVTRFVRQLVENVQREDLNDVDRAAALIRLRDLMAEEAGLLEGKQSWSNRVTWADVGKRLGFSRQRIHQLKNLLNLPPEIQEEVRAGRLSERDTRVYQGLPPEQQIALHKIRVGEELEPAEVKQIARELKQDPQRTVYEIIEVIRRPVSVRYMEAEEQGSQVPAGRSPAEAGLPPVSAQDNRWVQRQIQPERDPKHNINRVHWARDHLSRIQLPADPQPEERQAMLHILRLLQRDVESLIRLLAEE